MKVNQATHSVGVMCRLLHISRSGFYAWLDRPMSERNRSDLALTGKIEAIHRRSRGVYGSPNIHAELADDYGITRDPDSVIINPATKELLRRDLAKSAVWSRFWEDSPR